MAASDNLNENQAKHNKHWSDVWSKKVDESSWPSYKYKYRDAAETSRQPSSFLDGDAVYNWTKSSFFEKHPFPTRALMRHDPYLAEPTKHWDPNPKVAKQQQMPTPPKGAPMSFEVNPRPTEVLHDTLRQANAPEQVTVYHFGKPPKDARYASGSIDPEWPQHVRKGWRSTDPSINRGGLHIYVVPHENIIATGGSEKEVFFRRGSQLNKSRRTSKQQRNAEYKVSDDWDAHN